MPQCSHESHCRLEANAMLLCTLPKYIVSGICSAGFQYGYSLLPFRFSHYSSGRGYSLPGSSSRFLATPFVAALIAKDSILSFGSVTRALCRSVPGYCQMSVFRGRSRALCHMFGYNRCPLPPFSCQFVLLWFSVHGHEHDWQRKTFCQYRHHPWSH
jgi:hypothetical protein